jgi:hypothetical protein
MSTTEARFWFLATFSHLKQQTNKLELFEEVARSGAENV